MKNYLIKGTIVVALVTIMSAVAETNAQTSDIALSISVNPTTVTAGSTVGVFATVTNTSSAKVRTSVVISSLAPCGAQTTLGSNRLDLLPGQTIQVTVSYPVPADACTGNYVVSITSKSGGGGRRLSTAAPFASASLMVQ